MKALRGFAASLVLAAIVAAGALPASAHGGHPAPMIEITRPAAGAVYQNDVQQAGSVQQVGNLVNPAVSFGKTLTITVAWACPAQSTGARVTVQVRDSNGGVVHDMGTLFAGPSGSASTAWTTNASGTYRIEAQVTCTHHDPRQGGTVVDGADADFRNVIVITN